MSRRLTPWPVRRSTAWERPWASSAARMSPTSASAFPALCTCRTAVWRTRRKARVWSGGRLAPRGRVSRFSSRNASRSALIFSVLAPAARRILSPLVSLMMAKRRCSRVRWAWRRETASRAAALRTRSTVRLNMIPSYEPPARGGNARIATAPRYHGRRERGPRPRRRPLVRGGLRGLSRLGLHAAAADGATAGLGCGRFRRGVSSGPRELPGGIALLPQRPVPGGPRRPGARRSRAAGRADPVLHRVQLLPSGLGPRLSGRRALPPGSGGGGPRDRARARRAPGRARPHLADAHRGRAARGAAARADS